MSAPALLELDGVDVRYGRVAAVRRLTLSVDAGEIVGLIGPNGAGKSTTLHAIVGLLPPSAGEIRLRGESLRGRSPESVARAGVALVPEGRRIFGGFSVEENLRLGLAPALVDVVFETLATIRERGVTVLLVEQRAQRTVAFADRTYVLANGELRLTLTQADAADTSTMISAYLA